MEQMERRLSWGVGDDLEVASFLDCFEETEGDFGEVDFLPPLGLSPPEQRAAPECSSSSWSFAVAAAAQVSPPPPPKASLYHGVSSPPDPCCPAARAPVRAPESPESPAPASVSARERGPAAVVSASESSVDSRDGEEAARFDAAAYAAAVAARPPRPAAAAVSPKDRAVALHREALRETLEWAASRPMSPMAAASALLAPFAWVFDTIARGGPDPWGPDGGGVAWRVVRVLEMIAAVPGAEKAATSRCASVDSYVQWALHVFSRCSADGTDARGRAACAYDALAALEDALGVNALSAPASHPTRHRGLLAVGAGTAEFRESFLQTASATTNVKSFFRTWVVVEPDGHARRRNWIGQVASWCARSLFCAFGKEAVGLDDGNKGFTFDVRDPRRNQPRMSRASSHSSKSSLQPSESFPAIRGPLALAPRLL